MEEKRTGPITPQQQVRYAAQDGRVSLDNAAHHISGIRRHSISTTKRRMSRKSAEQILLEPTYRMEPKVKFNQERAERLIQAILDSRMKWTTRRASVSKYPDDADELTLSITDEIRASVRDLAYERYRLVVVVNLCEVDGGIPDIMLASRCLWNPSFDTFAQATVYTPRLYAVAVVYAVYWE